MFIGEAPGKDENKKGMVFIGKTGDEVNTHYLPLAGLRRSAVRFTNAIRCLPSRAGGKLDPNRAKDLALLDVCSACFLYPAIEKHPPKLLIPMGAFACKAICPGVSLELQHGIPVMTEWGIPAFPMYHPAGGIHEPKKMLLIRTDWHRLKTYLNGTLHVAEDAFPNPDYQEVTDAEEISALDPTQPLAIDTESRKGGAPFCLTYAQEPGTGRLIRASRGDLLEALSRQLDRWEAHLLFHHWLSDWPITQAMGVRVPERKVVDTMVRIFHLGNLNQGLKTVAYRELGMVMQDFWDVVSPHSILNVLYYYRQAQTYDWPKPEEELVQDEKSGLWKLYKPQSMNTKLKRFFTDYGKNPEKDVFKMWEDNWTGSHAMIEAECGPYPGLDVSHVPFGEIVYYACRDADATLRLFTVLERMRRRVRQVSQEHWREAA